MAQRQEAAVVTCGMLTLATNPAKVLLPWDGGIVRRVRIYISAGHAGLTGIALGYGGTPIIPRFSGGYYSGDDREVVMDYDDNVPNVPWSAFMCNLDQVTHAWEVNFELDDAPNTTPAIAPTVITPADILAAGTTAMSGV